MATSGTTSFKLNVSQLIEDAYDLIGGEQQLGRDPVVARRALNMLFIELSNRGFPLWTLELDSFTVTQGTATYTLDTDAMDVLEITCRRDSQDITLNSIAYEEWLAIPNKSTQGRPTQYLVQRDQGSTSLRLWPVPENSTDVILFWKIRYIQDAGSPTDDPDINRRFIPAMAYGLGYWLGMRRQVPADTDPKMLAVFEKKVANLKDKFEESLAYAVAEDRSRVDLSIIPRLR